MPGTEISPKFKKHSYPNFGVLESLFATEKLLNVFTELEQTNGLRNISHLIQARSYVANHFPIKENGYQYFPLTQMESKFASSPSDQTLGQIGEESGRKQFRRGFQSASSNYVPELDDRLYTQFPEDMPEVIREVLGHFKGQVSMTRFAILKAHQHVKEHTDNNLDHSIRIHIPLRTHPKCVFGVKRAGAWDMRHLPADGTAYFLNTAFPHVVHNDSDVDRLHLVINLNTQEDIQHLKLVD